ncbi:hypothetical protein F2Q65_01020 [Thiohalocapsa marina]|uniref:Uncharacterized protein n=1 Tax=Thiohalocapsa marina TaxID=424902 RepID=A0A5M8FVK3_9GAMM|nr:hypothetical protein [Thiohalocapsa marina]KAA6187852.1 hypothetical protein F2Q65_01020 [Thiohalocapsa marina]
MRIFHRWRERLRQATQSTASSLSTEDLLSVTLLPCGSPITSSNARSEPFDITQMVDQLIGDDDASL